MIVPDGVLFGSSTAHKALRRMLVEDQKLDAHRQAALRRVPALCRRLDRDPAVHQDELRRHRPRLVLRRARPTASRSTTSARRCCRPRSKLGPTPAELRVALADDEHAKNNLPDIAGALAGARRQPSASARAPRRASACRRPRSRRQDYDLSLNRYKEVVHDERRAPATEGDHRGAEGAGAGDCGRD